MRIAWAGRLAEGAMHSGWWSTPRDFHGLSLYRVLQTKIYVGVVWAFKTLIDCRGQRRRLSATRDLSGTGRERFALLVATGPSAIGLDVDGARRMQQAGGRIFVVNSYCDLEFAASLIPDFYVLTDPFWFASEKMSDRAARTWDYIRQHQSIRVVVPSCVPATMFPDEIVPIYVNTTGLEGWTKNTSPIRPRGYLGLTTYSALGLIEYMDFSTIYLSGVDNTAFQKLVCLNDGTPGLAGNHAYVEDGVTPLEPIRSLAAALEFYARHFADLEFFDTSRMVDLNENGMLPGVAKGVLP